MSRDKNGPTPKNDKWKNPGYRRRVLFDQQNSYPKYVWKELMKKRPVIGKSGRV